MTHNSVDDFENGTASRSLECEFSCEFSQRRITHLTLKHWIVDVRPAFDQFG